MYKWVDIIWFKCYIVMMRCTKLNQIIKTYIGPKRNIGKTLKRIILFFSLGFTNSFNYFFSHNVHIMRWTSLVV
jgi:hypothetical protein